jgi:hypothetical protein
VRLPGSLGRRRIDAVHAIGVSTLNPLSYDEFRKAYTQPSHLRQEDCHEHYSSDFSVR